ncbi:GNAT family N-acetyltransferase [Clostridium sp. 'deep sea']|uniref:GNAT family N-acetyltransferase n=1 Tax=Clostridium sp. 'deep sea' TaxID=2779445 RepID=UPI00189649CB|nr:GNAT family N-acetyltransferase [Clostridium sp. 'deep sea']QOR36795.1 GNAT family N-acetyltransferase [Clostridium sp. 'deep sea']
MNEVKIVHYEPKYAASLAHMWNKSGQNWGGDSTIRTAESVKEAEERYSNIYTFLAVAGEEVVGYCSFSNYKEDEGASYIPLLNVRPDYLGKKVGKMLVLKCVEMALKCEWPRLDLYTWTGNNKAVPLYKKCGFFWEEEDAYTHLMNFLPYVMDTEAVKEYFKEIDWYQDNKRKIEIKSDGNVEGQFDFYEYNWQKNDLVLNMEFERRGRGLTCIETNDYLIKTRLEKQKLICGSSYKIKYELTNKSGKPLQVSIEGQNDKNIKFNFNYSNDINNTEIVYGQFFVEDIKEKQAKIKTHPCVSSLIKINGKKSLFKIGVNAIQPIKIDIANDNEYKQLNADSICYINIENNFEQNIKLNFELINNDLVEFKNKNIALELEPKQKHHLAIPCIIKSYGFYSEQLQVKIAVNNNLVEHVTNLKTTFRGYYGMFHGETEEAYYLYNGPYVVKFIKESNYTEFYKLGMDEEEVIDTSIPQFGKPYYSEFKNKKPNEVKYVEKSNSECLILKFNSEKLPNIALNYILELFSGGIIKIYYEVENNSDKNVKDLFVCQDSYLLLNNGYLPYEQGIIISECADGVDVGNWDAKKLSENWLFSDFRNTKGIAWHPSLEAIFRGVSTMIESKINNIQAHKSVFTKPIILTIDTFKNWQEFRNYLGYTKKLNSVASQNSLISSINNNNPFIKDQFELLIYENKRQEIKGSIEVESFNNSITIAKTNLCIQNRKAVKSALLNARPEIDIVKLNIELNTQNLKREKAIFFVDSKAIKSKQFTEKGKSIYEVNNGIISLKAAPNFSPGIYSMQYKGSEWLNSSFPEPSIKAWWNCYTGGMFTMLDEFSFASLNKEEKQAQFVRIEDNLGNVWSGIKTSLIVTKHEKYKGITVNEYYLLLNGVPVVANFAVVSQTKGSFKQNLSLQLYSFIEQTTDRTQNWIKRCEGSEDVVFQYGEREFEIVAKDITIHGSKTVDYTLTRLLNDGKHVSFYTKNTYYAYDVVDISLASNSPVIIIPQFGIFSKESLSKEMLKDLKQVRFKLTN